MEEFIKLSAQTAGKDKVARLLQYFSKLLWYNIQKRKFSPVTVDKLKTLEYTLSTFRKLLRLGKSLEVLYSALKSIHYEDLALRLTITMSRISNALFLLTDHILWFGRSGLGTVNIGKWSDISNRCWLYSIMLNLCRDFYEILRIIEDVEGNPLRMTLSKSESVSIVCRECVVFGNTFIKRHRDIFWDTVKNACDVWIPLNTLGFTKFSPGLIGLFGTISSIAGLISLLDQKAKLLPS